MRNHLRSCITKAEISLFPITIVDRVNDKSTESLSIIIVFCNCRMPHFSKEMIACSVCHYWFHLDVCVAVAKNDRVKRWLCGNCTKIV